MKKFTAKVSALLVALTMLSSCTNEAGEINKQKMVGIMGAIGGGAIGSQIGKGSGKTVSIIGSSILGGLAGSEVGRSLDKADITYHNRTNQRALESNKAGIPSSWKNPDSGASGTVTPTKTFQQNGQYCREYTQSISVGGQAEKAYGTACRRPDGTWQVQ